MLVEISSLYAFVLLFSQIQASAPFSQQQGIKRHHPDLLRKPKSKQIDLPNRHILHSSPTIWRHTQSLLTSLRGGDSEEDELLSTYDEDSSMDILPPSLRSLVEDTRSSQRKIIVVTGGVLSGIGKGVTASSIGVLLRAMGLRVTALKIDPYLNVDAGTMSPFEHGEVFVLDDGGETDLDLGNYERFLSVSLTKESNLSTGKIYQVRYTMHLRLSFFI